MTFQIYKQVIEDGDIAIMVRGHNDLLPITIESGQVLNINAGSFKHDDFIGQKYGSKFAGHKGKGYVTLLHPTPELWTLSLPHRTQIIYQMDISIISSVLRIKPGSQVIESGTGSGSMSHSLLRTIIPTGHLYSFEYHTDRCEAVKREFARHGLSEFVTVACTDVCKGDGFVGVPESSIDAVFLDLPAPWDAISHLVPKCKLNSLTRVCCFSPCIEQVNRTCVALRANGFVNIQMIECLAREMDVREVSLRLVDDARAFRSKRSAVTQPALVSLRPMQVARGHTSFLTFAVRLPISS